MTSSFTPGPVAPTDRHDSSAISHAARAKDKPLAQTVCDLSACSSLPDDAGLQLFLLLLSQLLAHALKSGYLAHAGLRAALPTLLKS